MTLEVHSGSRAAQQVAARAARAPAGTMADGEDFSAAFGAARSDGTSLGVSADAATDYTSLPDERLDKTTLPVETLDKTSVPVETQDKLLQAIGVEKLFNWEDGLERRIEHYEDLDTLEAKADEQRDLISELDAIAEQTSLTGEQKKLLAETKKDLAVTEHRIENFETLDTLEARLETATDRIDDLSEDAIDAWKDVFQHAQS